MSPKKKAQDSYTGRYRYDPSDGVWLAHIDEIPQAHTFARTLPKAKAHLREALALWLNVQEGDLTILPI